MDNKNGFIKLSRNLLNHWITLDVRYLSWWVWMLLNANWGREQRFYFSKSFFIERGELAESGRSLARKLKSSRPTIEHFLKALETDGMISRRREKGNFSVITIINYDKYQDSESATEDATDDTRQCANVFTEGQANLKGTQQSETKEVASENKKNRAKGSADIDTKEQTEGINQGWYTNSLPRLVNPEITNINKKIKNNNNNNLSSNEESVENGFSTPTPDQGEEEFFLNLWNDQCKGTRQPKACKLSSKRKLKLRARAAEWAKAGADARTIAQGIFAKVATSNFLNGKNNRGWICGFDWVIENDTNWIKILEGNYDNSNSAGSAAGGCSPDEVRKLISSYQRTTGNS